MAVVELHGIRVVVFDLDDTLYAERDYVFSGYRAVARWLAPRAAKAPEAIEERLKSLFETPARPRVFNHLLTELNLAAHEKEWVPAMIDIYRGHRPDIALLPDAERALRRWGGRFATALISDGDQTMQQGKVDVLGLAGRIDTVVLTGQWGRPFWKPHGRAFEWVEQAHSASGKELVYLADNPVKDFISPRQRGWQSVRLRRPGGIYADAEPAEAGRADMDLESLDDVTITS